MSFRARTDQMEVTTGTANNDTVPTLGKVEDMIGAAQFWDRNTSGTPFIIPHTATDNVHVGGILKVDNIAELTGSAGVTIESVEIKSGNITLGTGATALIGDIASGGNLLLQSTSHATKGEVSVTDGSDFVFTSGISSGVFKVEADADGSMQLGRAKLFSVVTDVMYLSHFDNDNATDYAIKQLASGRTCINAKTGTDVSICINNVAKATVSATGSLVDNININGNTISSTSGDINIDPTGDAIINGHWKFFGKTLVAISDSDTTLTAYAGKNITVEGVTFDGGVVAGITSLTVQNVTISGNTISTSSGALNLDSFTDDIFMPNITASSILVNGIATIQENILLNCAQQIKRTASAVDYNPSALTTDYLIAITDTAAPRAVIISTEDIQSGSTANPRTFVVKDESYNAGTNNITVSGETGTINNQASVLIAQDGNSITLYADGVNLHIY